MFEILQVSRENIPKGNFMRKKSLSQNSLIWRKKGKKNTIVPDFRAVTLLGVEIMRALLLVLKSGTSPSPFRVKQEEKQNLQNKRVKRKIEVVETKIHLRRNMV